MYLHSKRHNQLLFLLCRRKIFNAKSNASIVYASLKSAIILILHSNETYVPIVTDLLELCKADSDNDDIVKSQSTDCKDEVYLHFCTR